MDARIRSTYAGSVQSLHVHARLSSVKVHAAAHGLDIMGTQMKHCMQ